MLLAKLKVAMQPMLLLAVVPVSSDAGGSPSILPTLKTENSQVAEKKDAQKKDKRFPDGRDHNFGTVKSGPTLKYTFRIVNTSDIPLEITALRGSSCHFPGNAWVSKHVLQPNEEGKVMIAIDTRRFRGSKTASFWLKVEQRGIKEDFPFSIKANSIEGN